MTECQALKTARESGSMLNFHKTSGCVMCVKTDVFLQFSSPSLAPVCGTNCPKTDAFSAYDGCVFGIVWNYTQKSPVRFRHRGMRFQHPKKCLKSYIIINAFSASGSTLLALSGTILKLHTCVCGIRLWNHLCVFSIGWLKAKKLTKNYICLPHFHLTNWICANCELYVYLSTLQLLKLCDHFHPHPKHSQPHHGPKFHKLWLKNVKRFLSQTLEGERRF